MPSLWRRGREARLRKVLKGQISTNKEWCGVGPNKLIDRIADRQAPSVVTSDGKRDGFSEEYV
jgi:hypothetical protein